jgi:hypothetical protein
MLNIVLLKLKESAMIKRRFIVIMLCAMAVLGFLLAGCTSTDIKSNVAGEYSLITKIASKDFIPLGFISVTATETVIISPLHFTKEMLGERVTFDLLLKEAMRLYPETSDIINIRIDRIDQNKTTLVDFFIGSTRTVKYIGNALAIKYTDALEEVREPSGARTDTLPPLSTRYR